MIKKIIKFTCSGLFISLCIFGGIIGIILMCGSMGGFFGVLGLLVGLFAYFILNATWATLCLTISGIVLGISTISIVLLLFLGLFVSWLDDRAFERHYKN